jgi:hypothetical protein
MNAKHNPKNNLKVTSSSVSSFLKCTSQQFSLTVCRRRNSLMLPEQMGCALDARITVAPPSLAYLLVVPTVLPAKNELMRTIPQHLKMSDVVLKEKVAAINQLSATSEENNRIILICRSEIFELRTHTQSLGDERGTTC